MPILTIDERLDCMEDRLAKIEGIIERNSAALDELRTQILSIIAGQAETILAVKRHGDEQIESLMKTTEEQKQVLQDEAQNIKKEIQDQMLGQSASIATVSVAMINLQRTISKYAAAGALAGAVILYILAKATGL